MDRTGIIVVSICVLIMGWWLYDQQQYAKQLALHPPAQVQTTPASQTPAANASMPVAPAMAVPFRLHW